MTLQRKIFRDTALVTVIGIVGQVLGFVLTLMIARRFGASWVTDAYYVAIVVPVMLTSLIGGAVKLVFVPVFVEERLADPEGAARIVQSVLALLLTVAILAALLVGVMVGLGWLDLGTTERTRDLTRRLILELLPLVPLTIVANLYNAVYNAYQRFALVEVARALVFLVTLTSLVTLGDHLGIHSLVAGQVLGQAMALAMTYFVVRRHIGIDLRPRFGLSRPVRRMLGLATVALGSYVFALVNPLVGRVVASYLAVGSVSYLSYAEKLTTIPALVIGTGFTGVLVSYWSKLTAEGEREQLRESFNRGLSVLVMILVPMAVGLILLRHPLVAFVYERGAFTTTDSRMTANVFAILAAGVIPTYLNMMIMRIFLSEKALGTLVWLGAQGFVLNLGLMGLLVWMGAGIYGIAAAMVISLSSVVVIESVIVHRRYVAFSLRWLGGNALRVLVATAVMAVVVVLLRYFFFDPQRHPALLVVVSLSALGAGVYVLLLKLMGHPEVGAVLRAVVRRKSVHSMERGE